MEPQTPPPEPHQPLDPSHVDGLLAMHATERPGPVKRYLGTILVTLVLLVGAAAFGIAHFADRQAAIPETTHIVVDVSPLPTDTPVPAASPNARPPAARAAVGEWPLSA